MKSSRKTKEREGASERADGTVLGFRTLPVHHPLHTYSFQAFESCIPWKHKIDIFCRNN